MSAIVRILREDTECSRPQRIVGRLRKCTDCAVSVMRMLTICRYLRRTLTISANEYSGSVANDS